MKNILLLLTLMFTVAQGFASNIIEDLSSEKVDFVIENTENYNLFTTVSFDSDNNNITLKTIEEISFIKVLNSKGEVEFQMPVLSSNLHLYMQDFEEGTYDVTLTFKDMDVETKMVIK